MTRAWSQRLLLIAGLAAVLVIVWTTPALADDGALGGLVKARDSTDISIWDYQLSINGGGPTQVGYMIWSFFISMLWSIYVLLIAIVIKVLVWVLGFGWLDWISEPLDSMSDSLQSLVSAFGVQTLFLTIAVFAGVLWLIRGKVAAGVYEIGMSMVIAALAAGIFVNPFAMVAGSDGLLVKARNAGLEISTGLNPGGKDITVGQGNFTECTGEKPAEPGTACDAVSTALIDTFIRQPHMILNFGEVLTGECAAVYDEALRDPDPADLNKLRDGIKEASECENGEELWTYSDQPGAVMFMTVLLLLPTVVFIAAFALVLGVSVFLTSVQALFYSLKMIVVLVTGLLPGGMRGHLWSTLANLIVSVGELVIAVVFLVSYLFLLREFFSASEGSADGRLGTFVGVDLLLIAGCVVYLKWRKQLHKAGADKIAALLGTRPGGGTPAPAKMSGPGVASLVGSGAALYNTYKMRKGLAKRDPADPGKDPSPPVTEPHPISVPSSVSKQPALTASAPKAIAAGPGEAPPEQPGPTSPNQPPKQPNSGPGTDPHAVPKRRRGRDRIRKVAKVATEAGVSAATAGSSTVASATKIGARTATRSAAKSAAHSRVEKKLGRKFPSPQRSVPVPKAAGKGYDSFKVDGVKVQQPARPRSHKV